jgi:hypothetical protein
MKKEKQLPITPISIDVLIKIGREREEMADQLNEELRQGCPLDDPQEDNCEHGAHHVLVNDLGLPQCESCLLNYNDWKAVRNELEEHFRRPDGGIEVELVNMRLVELKNVARKVKNGNPPGNISDKSWIRYLTKFGYQYIHRVFYDRD